MSPNADAPRPPVLDAVVAEAGARPAPVVLLALAHALERSAGAARPPSTLALPALEQEAATRVVDADLVERLGARLASAGDDITIGPGVLGAAHEAVLDRGHRRRGGVFYTPAAVARGLVGEVVARFADEGPERGGGPGALAGDQVPGDALVDRRGAPWTVCDPAIGGGAFLLAAADALAALGVPVDEVVEHRLFGADVDPLAVAVSEASLVLWARARGVEARPRHLARADSLAAGSDVWPGAPVNGFASVVGNPPFQSQLGRDTARSAAQTERLRDRWGPAVFRYTDSAALFLLAAVGLAAPGGRVAMILPTPVLVTDDAARVRRAVQEQAVLEHLWIGGDELFDAGVRVCAPVLRRTGGAPTTSGTGDAAQVTRSIGPAFAPLPERLLAAPGRRAVRWGSLVADVAGVPDLGEAAVTGRLGDFCTATAGFRDQFYGVAPFVSEAADGSGSDPSASPSAGPPVVVAKLVTSGLVDPARCTWGRRVTRFAGQRWQAPVVDLEALDREDATLAAWARARLVPKVVVATQTRVLEAAVDVDGDWFPSVPTIALSCPPERLWDAAAVVLAPPTSAWAMHRHAGAALSADALKVSASQLLEAPLPVDLGAWSEGAELVRAVTAAGDALAWHEGLARFGEAMTRAYAAPDEVLAWWLDRLPRWR